MTPRKVQQHILPQAVYLRLMLILLISFLLILIARAYFLTPGQASGERLWQVSLDISFVAHKQETLLNISTPFTTPYIELIQQSISHPGMKIRHSKPTSDHKRGINAIASIDGKIEVTAEFLLQQSSVPTMWAPVLSTQMTERYLQDKDHLNINHETIQKLSEKLNDLSADNDKRLLQIYEYTHSFRKATKDLKRSAPEIIHSGQASAYERNIVFVALARSMQIPTRLVSGFILSEQNNIKPHTWVQSYNDNSWQAYDSYHGYQKSVPTSYLPFKYGDSELVTLVSGDGLNVEYFIEEVFHATLKKNRNEQSLSDIFNLPRLSLDTRNTLAILLLLPLGILITVIFRHFFGLHSYGVFTPTLLALALSHNMLGTTLSILVVIIFFSVIGRITFPKNMERTPRLAIIFTFVASSMALGVSLIDYYTPSPDGYAVLLPIVILTSLIDRFFLTVDSKGTRIAYLRLFWTLVITLVTTPLIQYEALGHFIVGYPEIHIVSLMAILSVTRYNSKLLKNILPPVLKETPTAKSSSTETSS